jgi:hypothetical protein
LRAYYSPENTFSNLTFSGNRNSAVKLQVMKFNLTKSIVADEVVAEQYGENNLLTVTHSLIVNQTDAPYIEYHTTNLKASKPIFENEEARNYQLKSTLKSNDIGAKLKISYK